MRDIRGDLQQRVDFVEQQISAAHAQFQQLVERLQSERDATVAELNKDLAALGNVMEAELRLASGSPRVAAPSAQAQTPLADFFVRKLTEVGPTSKDNLIKTAVKEGYFPNPESAGMSVNATLTNLVRSNRIRQLPDGLFAPLTISQTIMLRRAV
jgi:hypothetical protein